MSVSKCFVLFFLGGAAYAVLEIAFRGHTHWSMFIAGGICFIFLYAIAVNFQAALWQKAILGGLIITAVEFLVGVVVNITLRWDVWDYSHHNFNLYGQICLVFSLLWSILSVPAIALCRIIDKYLFGR